jgi:hypothetical protein
VGKCDDGPRSIAENAVRGSQPNVHPSTEWLRELTAMGVDAPFRA